MGDAIQTATPAGEPTFQIGLALAGAISAGAYTAGVLDFLFQALTEWDKHRGESGIPNHRIVLKVIAGASAGGITGALGAIALARGLAPRGFPPGQKFYPDRYPEHQSIQCVLPSLYETWVTQPAMISADSVGGLLAIDDLRIDASKPILRSLLDASLLDTIKKTAIEAPAKGSDEIKPAVPFIAEKLHIYLTISNMRGIPFKVEFGKNTYGMLTIGDRIHYVVTDLGSRNLSVAGSWVDDDAALAGYEISVKTLPRRGQPLPEQWDHYGTSALASGAFPVGLAPREIRQPWQYYLSRRYPLPIPSGNIKPNFPPGAGPDGEFVFQSVDGGIVNNNPFDYAQYALFDGAALRPASGQAVDRAIIMVAPFPEPPALQPEGTPTAAVIAIIKRLFPSLVNQARFRTADLAPAFDDRDHSRYLIAPLRRIPRLDEDSQALPKERFAIACGLLGGFGGFLDEKFRDHDFQLGRRNCQQFLKTSFWVPSGNVVVGETTPGAEFPIIPLVGDAEPAVQLPEWPRMKESDFNTLCERAEQRIDAVVPYLIDSETFNVKLRLALKFGWKTFIRNPVRTFVRGTMLADLVRRGQIEGWQIPDDIANSAKRAGGEAIDVQEILGELLNPAFDFRTPKSIANAAHLTPQFVSRMLEELSRETTPAHMRTWQDGNAWAFVDTKPGFFKRLPGVKSLLGWWDAPSIS